MKKEIIIAIVVGLFIGLIFTLGISTANKAINQQKAKKLTPKESGNSLTSTNNNQQKTLTITSHENFDLINQSEISLSGIAWPKAVIALIAENQTKLIQADAEGIFIFKFNLIKGFNEITLIATDETNATKTENIVLTYSTSKIEL
ncbi:MAG: hypothetical protein UV54_C0044G0007 [Candidatus Beckwithbacteria bacterium GW2011_GWA2_43_10]|uniref:Uncharacterized protein n=1 Tax=Candidatus Beckwithbacteria bacterium GW2011_GWA2_43_10 TaxID=1618369 RepID=A0A0G1EWT0_9BACT|nr:MAG: hypothetical protein UV54_C0044G0007 [Candidatus Beckwithbacteria bacterium GW2011_GWA2_43_10]